MDNINFSNLDRKHFNAIIKIANSTLGENYISKKELNDILYNENAHGFVIKAEHRIAGFCLFDIVDFDEIQTVTHNAIPLTYKDDYFGYVKTIAIDSAYQGRGLGNKIMNHCVSLLGKIKIDKLFTSIWYKPENTANINMVKRSGFKESVLIDDYWLKDSIDNNFTCPICGFPCHCKCLIMTNFI